MLLVPWIFDPYFFFFYLRMCAPMQPIRQWSNFNCRINFCSFSILQFFHIEALPQAIFSLVYNVKTHLLIKQIYKGLFELVNVYDIINKGSWWPFSCREVAMTLTSELEECALYERKNLSVYEWSQYTPITPTRASCLCFLPNNIVYEPAAAIQWRAEYLTLRW